MSNPRVCPVCGYQLLENENVCIICGKRFDNNNTPTQQKQEPTYAQPQQQYQSSSPVRTYTTSRQPQSTPTRTYTTSSGMDTNTNIANGKKKMNPVLKVFLIIFGIQFAMPIIMGIIMLVVFLFKFNSVETHINDIMNADVGQIKIIETKVNEDDCTINTQYENDVAGDVLKMSDDNIIYIPIELDNGEYEAHVFIDADKWDSVSYETAGKIRLVNYTQNASIEFYLPGEADSHPINSIDLNSSNIDIRRYDDINFGGDMFKTIKYNGKYYFICELSEDFYISCEVKTSDGETDLEELFPLVSLSKH